MQSPRQKTRQKIEVEADSLEEAREQVQSRIPEGLVLLSEKVISDSKTKKIKCIADTVEAAYEKAQSKLPPAAGIIDKKVCVNPSKQTMIVEAFDEKSGLALVKPKIGKSAKVEKLVLKTGGNKGFLGLGKKPNSYEAQINQPAVIEITYREKAKILANFGEKKEPKKREMGTRATGAKKVIKKQKAKINRVEICFDKKLPPSLPEIKAVEDLVKYFHLQDSFTRDVDISPSYGKIPDIADSLSAGECTEELNQFIIIRAVLLGMKEKEIDAIIPHLFSYHGILGVIIAGYV